MKPHQERVVQEKAELDSKIEKLISFVLGESFSGVDHSEQIRMEYQLSVMRMYSRMLGDRIRAF